MEGGNKLKCEMSATTGSYIFGLINAVLNALGVLIFVIIWSQWNLQVRLSDDAAANVVENEQIFLTLFYTVVIYMVIILMATDFTFCVLLLHGIRKNVAGFVKSYLIYGIVRTVLALLAVLVLLFAYELPLHGIILLAVAGLYSLILLMVHKTHQKMTVRSIFAQFDDKQLSLTNKIMNC